MRPTLKPGTDWATVFSRCRAAASEAYESESPSNLVCGEWTKIGTVSRHTNPVDGTEIPGPSRLTGDDAEVAVSHASREHRRWTRTDLDERKRLIAEALDAIEAHRELLALLLVWEIGKPWRLACADVDRCVDGVRWYIQEIERQLAVGSDRERRPLSGPVCNIASWNYPMSVQVHAELVQLLAGNAVLAKTPTQGGFHTLTVAHALMRRSGLPVSLLSGPGPDLGRMLIRSDGVGALAFVGGRANGRKAAIELADAERRHILEQEGLNTWGVWGFSDWDLLAEHIRKGFEYAKQRCTAYPRYVVQRRLFTSFLDAYLPAVRAVRFGHPLAVVSPSDPLPELDFGPVISATKATDLHSRFEEALALGAIPVYRGDPDGGFFLDGQDTSAYVAPACILQPPSSWTLHHSEPFGPLDSVVIVDTEPELLAAMNVSNGSLVSSIATDDMELAARVAEQLRAFKVGINRPRSRGDREEVFGGLGHSWKGAFVGGDLLVQAVTRGPEGQKELLFGNFPDYSLLPQR